MKTFGALVLLAAGFCIADAHPVEKVIELLKGLSSKVEEEGKSEALTYEKFVYWCKNSAQTLASAIAEGKAGVDTLKSTVASKTETAASLEDQIGKLEKEIAHLDGAGEAAAKMRGEASSNYDSANADYTSTIAAIAEALTALEGARDETESASLLAKALPLVETMATDAQRSVLEAFVQEEPEAAPDASNVKAMGDREAHVDKYASKTHSVIELLKELQAKFEAEKLAATKAETNSLNAFDLANQARDEALRRAEEAKAAKADALGDTNGQLEEAKASLASTESDLEADSASLAQTQGSCNAKRSEWAERSAIRAGELKAMEAAIKILAKVAGVRTEAPTNPVPPPSPIDAESFLQVAAEPKAADPKARAVHLLRFEAQKSHSRALAQLAQEVAAHLTGPFDEVNNMIEKMIFRLMAEQKDEDEHKHWCDLELEKTNTSINNKEEKHDETAAKLEVERAAVQKLSEEIKEANDMVAAITSHMKMATEIRETGRKENALALKDSEDAQTAVANAISVLRDFYKESGSIEKQPWESLLQQPVELPADPATWGDSYVGVSDPKAQPTGIITVLEQVASDFATMASDTKAQEAMDQKSFEDDIKASKIEKARRESESAEKGSEVKRRSDKIETLNKALKHTADELYATRQYLKDLAPACVTGDSTYEDRKAAREEEKEALHEAQAILKDAFKEDAAPVTFLHRQPKSVRLAPSA